MKINILEFSIDNNLFGIRTEYVKNIFDIENIKRVPLAPDYMAGVTTHGKHIYPLICIEKLLEISSNCNNPVGKTAITINIDGKHYSIIVDEIHKIQEIEKTNQEDDVINFYNLQGKVLEEITPQFLKRKIKVPPLNQNIPNTLFKDKNLEKKEDEINFLIFKIGSKYIGINAQFIKKVEYLEDLHKTPTERKDWIESVYLVKDTPVKSGNLKKLLKIEEGQEEFLIILEKDKKLFGLLADEILDIYTIKKSQLNKGKDEVSILKDFVVYNKQLIPILSENFIQKILEEHSLETSKTESTNTKNKKEIDILIFSIGQEKLGIKMENVHEVIEYEDVHISNYPTEIKEIKGLIATGKESLFLLSFEEYLNQKINPEENSKILIIQDKNIKIALLISDIEDIMQIPQENLAETDSEETFIKGIAIDKKGYLINLINPKWILYKFKKEYKG